MAEKVCPLAKKCGGCDYQGISYEEQLKKKENSVWKLMKEFGEIRPIIGADDPYHYRNKVHAVFSRKRNGEIVSGIYQEGTHKVVPVDTCQIENEKADEIIVSVRKLLKSFKVKVYPIAAQQRCVTPFHEALFTSTSALCVTGLVVQDTGSYWSAFGQSVILLLIQIGGLGVITVGAAFALLSGSHGKKE